MKLKITLAALAIALTTLTALEWERLSQVIWPDRRIHGTWQSTDFTEGGIQLPHGVFPIFDFDPNRREILFSDGACSSQGPAFTFDGTVLLVEGDHPGDPAREFRVRFHGREQLTIEDVGEKGTLDMIRIDRDQTSRSTLPKDSACLPLQSQLKFRT